MPMTRLPTEEDDRRRTERPGARRWAKRAVELLDRATQVLAALVAAAMTAIIFASVVWRYALQAPITWAHEASLLLFVWLTFLGAALAMRRREHSGFEDLLARLPRRLRTGVVLVNGVLTGAFLLLLVVLGTQIVPLLAGQQMVSLPLGEVWLYAALPVGSLLILIQLVGHALGVQPPEEQAGAGEGGAA
jgi:TRAP-type C4-dicarboxylate transport system permease small subunit